MSNASSKSVQPGGTAGAPKTGIHTVAQTLVTLALGLLLYLVPPSLASIALVIGLELAGQTESQADHWLNQTTIATFLFILLTETMVVAALVCFRNMYRISWRDIGVKKPAASHILYMLTAFGAYYAIYLIAALVLSQIVHLDFDQRQELGFQDNIAGYNLVLAFVSLVILPPLVEELLFRGFLYTRLRSELSIKPAAIILSLLFASAHLEVGSGNPLLWVAALDTFILSLVLVYLREKTGTIWAGVGVHALKNSVAFVVLFIATV